MSIRDLFNRSASSKPAQRSAGNFLANFAPTWTRVGDCVGQLQAYGDRGLRKTWWTKHQLQVSPGSMELTSGWALA